MTAGDPGERGLGEGSLRSLLERAVEDDSCRLRALGVLAEQSVLAATWPGSAEAVRTLTNGDGEQAMPLFTNREELQAAARRFGWTNPDGSVSCRELPAREALTSALDQQVHFVVLDLCADHAAEFANEEIEVALARLRPKPAGASPGAARRAPSAPFRPPLLSKPPLSLGEMDMPFSKPPPAARESGVPVAVEEIVVTPARRPGARPDPRAEPEDGTPRTALAAVALAPRAEVAKRAASRGRHSRDLVPASAPLSAPLAPAPVAPAPAPQPFSPIEPTVDAPFGSTAPAAPSAPPRDALPSLDVPALPSFGAPPLPALDAPPALPALDAPPPLVAAAPAFAYGDGDGGVGVAGDGPEARPGALHAAVLVAQVGKLAKDSATQQAAAEVAEMLKDMARKGAVDDAQASAEPTAAHALAGMLQAEADAKRNKSAARTQLGVAPAAEVPAPPADAAEKSPEKAAGKSFRASETPLADSALDAFSEVLRKYPEVEWACEVSDGGARTIIGVRIDPTFLTRASEIEGAVAKAADARKLEISVLLLHDAPQMREARAAGNVFFPWRKRGKR